MKVTAVTAMILRTNVTTPFTSARGWWYKTKNAMLVHVETDEGIDGWGEAYGPAECTKAVVDSLLAPLVIGQDPMDTDVIWEKMYQRIEDYAPQGFGVAAISAIDIALWDIKGKKFGVPVYKLLGGAFRSEVTPYATGLYFTFEEGDFITPAVEEAVKYKELGFKGIKMKIALNRKDEFERVKAVRDAVGNDVEIMVDANHGYSLYDAQYLARKFEPLDISWFEEPISAHDLNGYADLRTKTSIPLAGGENNFTRYAFKDIIEKRAMDIIQPDLCCCGGITEVMRISALAEVSGTTLMMHVWGSAVGLFAALNVMAALPPAPHSWKPAPVWMEYEQTESPFREKLVNEPVRRENGVVKIPSGPGLGFTINEEIINKYRVK